MRNYLIIAFIIGVCLVALELTSDPKVNISRIIQAAHATNTDNPIVADLSAAQAILESGLQSKPSQLAIKYNNLFGIKGTGTGKVIDGKMKNRVNLPTKEYSQAHGWEEVDQFFAVNASLEDSFKQHRELFERGTRDNPKRYLPVLKAKTFEEAAQAVRKAGYATDPAYPGKLIAVYNKYIKNKFDSLPRETKSEPETPNAFNLRLEDRVKKETTTPLLELIKAFWGMIKK